MKSVNSFPQSIGFLPDCLATTAFLSLTPVPAGLSLFNSATSSLTFILVFPVRGFF